MDNDEKQKALERFGEWEHYALEDEQMVEIAIKENGPFSQICLHSQQMAEKYLKGFLAYHKEPLEKIHQLDMLISLCKKYDNLFYEIEEDAFKLNEYYITARYPADIPLESFTRNMAEEACKSAKKIKEFILARIR